MANYKDSMVYLKAPANKTEVIPGTEVNAKATGLKTTITANTAADGKEYVDHSGAVVDWNDSIEYQEISQPKFHNALGNPQNGPARGRITFNTCYEYGDKTTTVNGAGIIGIGDIHDTLNRMNERSDQSGAAIYWPLPTGQTATNLPTTSAANRQTRYLVVLNNFTNAAASSAAQPLTVPVRMSISATQSFTV